MVYTGNEVNRCTTERADKHRSFGVQVATYAYARENAHYSCANMHTACFTRNYVLS